MGGMGLLEQVYGRATIYETLTSKGVCSKFGRQVTGCLALRLRDWGGYLVVPLPKAYII